MQWADRIITISDYSRGEIERHFDIDASRIDVVPLGVDERWFIAPTEEARQRVRDRYQLPPSYFLFVGTLQPRKNVEALTAFNKIALEGKEQTTQTKRNEEGSRG